MGVGLLLVVVAVPAALDGRSGRNDLRMPIPGVGRSAPGGTLLVAERPDLWDGQKVTRRIVAGGAISSPRPPGVERLPGPGELVLSPALALIRDQPGAEALRDRYQGTIVGLVGDPGLLEPAELIAYVGASPESMSVSSGNPAENPVVVAGFGPSASGAAVDDDDPRLLAEAAATLVVILLCALLVVLLGSATQLAARARAARIASLRLIGASARACRLVVAGEVTVAATIGTVLGLVGFLLARGAIFAGWSDAPWFPADIGLGPASYVVLIAAPALAQVVAQLASRRAVREAFGVRRQSQFRLRPLPRLLPTMISATLLWFLAFEPGWIDRAQQGRLLIGAVVVFLLSLPLSLPVVLRGLGVLWAAAARGPVAHLAMRRMAFEATTVTRVVVATAEALVIAGVISAVFLQSPTLAHDDELLAAGNGRYLVVERNVEPSLPTEMRQVDGVQSVLPVSSLTLIAAGPASATSSRLPGATGGIAVFALAVACPDVLTFLEADPARCGDARSVVAADPGQPIGDGCAQPPCVEPGDRAAVSYVEGGQPKVIDNGLRLPTKAIGAPGAVPDFVQPSLRDPVWIDPAEVGDLAKTARLSVLVRTDGSPAAEQRVRRAAMQASPLSAVSSLPAKVAGDRVEESVGRRVASSGAALALALGLVSMVVAGTDSLLERRKLTGSLLAVGVSRGAQWRTQMIFLVMPAVVACAVGGVTGVLFAGIMDRVNRQPFTWRLELLPTALGMLAITTLCLGVIVAVTLSRSSVGDALRRE
jgi:hypothetical protein